MSLTCTPTYHHSGRALGPGYGPSASCSKLPVPNHSLQGYSGNRPNNEKNIFPISWEHAPWKSFSAVGPHAVPSTPQQPREAGCELWGRKKFQNTVGPPKQSQWGKNVSLTEKVPVHPANAGPKQHAAEQGGMVAGRDGQDALSNKQPPRCWLYPEHFPTRHASRQEV